MTFCVAQQDAGRCSAFSFIVLASFCDSVVLASGFAEPGNFSRCSESDASELVIDAHLWTEKCKSLKDLLQ